MCYRPKPCILRNFTIKKNFNILNRTLNKNQRNNKKQKNDIILIINVWWIYAKKKFFEEKFKVDIKVTPEIDLITIDPIQNEFSNEDINKGFINLCINILNEIMQRRKEQEEEEIEN